MIELLVVGAVCLTTIVCTSLSVVSAIHKRELEADKADDLPSPFEEKRRLLEREYQIASEGATLTGGVADERIKIWANRRKEIYEQLLSLAEEEANWRKWAKN